MEPLCKWSLLVLSCGALISVLAVRLRRDRRVVSPGVREWIDSHRFEILPIGTFALYWIAPLTLFATTYLFPRFLILAWCLTAPVVSPKVLDRDSALPRTMGLLLAALPLAFVMLLLPHFQQIDSPHARSTRSAAIHPGGVRSGKDITMSKGNADPTTLYRAPMMSNHVVTRLGGRVLVSFLDSPIAPVYTRKQYQWNNVRERNDIRTGFPARGRPSTFRLRSCPIA